MCSKRFLPTVLVSVALCGTFIGGYFWFLQVTTEGGYTEWSVWSNCSTECGEGVQTRYRLCANPPPGKYGKDCYRFGNDKDSKPCFLKICPVDGKFSDWTAFSACDKKCGGGKQFRTRQCNNPPAVFGGKPCEGSTREEQECNKEPCPPVHGGYTAWSAYGPCSVTCGKGTMTRTRSCINPPPSNGGKPCEGPASETSQCDKDPCPTVKPKQDTTQAGQKPAEQATQNTQQASSEQKPEEKKQ